jgi:hypothetical protein
VPAKQGGNKGRWKKGESGNPKGRPRVGLAAAELVRKVGDEEWPNHAGLTRIEGVIRRLYQGAVSGNTRAALILLDRGWGKPPQPVALGSDDNLNPVKIVVEYVEGEMSEASSRADCRELAEAQIQRLVRGPAVGQEHTFEECPP